MRIEQSGNVFFCIGVHKGKKFSGRGPDEETARRSYQLQVDDWDGTKPSFESCVANGDLERHKRATWGK